MSPSSPSVQAGFFGGGLLSGRPAHFSWDGFPPRVFTPSSFAWMFLIRPIKCLGFQKQLVSVFSPLLAFFLWGQACRFLHAFFPTVPVFFFWAPGQTFPIFFKGSPKPLRGGRSPFSAYSLNNSVSGFPPFGLFFCPWRFASSPFGDASEFRGSKVFFIPQRRLFCIRESFPEIVVSPGSTPFKLFTYFFGPLSVDSLFFSTRTSSLVPRFPVFFRASVCTFDCGFSCRAPLPRLASSSGRSPF